MIPCKIEGCDRPNVTKIGYCVMHYKRWKRNGTPDRVIALPNSIIECTHCGKTSSRITKGYCKPCYLRFLKKGYVERDVAPAGSGTLTKAGYKLVTFMGEREYEHRIKARAKGKQVVHHKDGNPANNDPSNLELYNSQSEHMKHHAATDSNWGKHK